MQIGNNSPLNNRPERPRKTGSQVDITRTNREGIEKAAQESEQTARAERAQELQQARMEAARPKAEIAPKVEIEKADKVDLSQQARSMSAEELPGPRSAKEAPAERATRVQDLKRAHAENKLNTPERISRAADLLMGD